MALPLRTDSVLYNATHRISHETGSYQRGGTWENWNLYRTYESGTVTLLSTDPTRAAAIASARLYAGDEVAEALAETC